MESLMFSLLLFPEGYGINPAIIDLLFCEFWFSIAGVFRQRQLCWVSWMKTLNLWRFWFNRRAEAWEFEPQPPLRLPKGHTWKNTDLCPDHTLQFMLFHWTRIQKSQRGGGLELSTWQNLESPRCAFGHACGDCLGFVNWSGKDCSIVGSTVPWLRPWAVEEGSWIAGIHCSLLLTAGVMWPATSSSSCLDFLAMINFPLTVSHTLPPGAAFVRFYHSDETVPETHRF